MCLINLMCQGHPVDWACAIWTKSRWELPDCCHFGPQTFLHCKWKTNLLTIGALASRQVWQALGRTSTKFEDLGHVTVLNVVTKRFLCKVHGVVAAWTVQQRSQTQRNSHVFGSALAHCKDLLKAFSPIILVDLSSHVARAGGSRVGQPQQVLLWLCRHCGHWCKDALVRRWCHSSKPEPRRVPHMKSKAKCLSQGHREFG